MNPTPQNELALFAGAGGGILGGKLLGWKTICAVEWNAYARDVLVARQNDGCLPPFPIWDDIQTFDGRPWRGRVDVVSGGFPCQDISAAGKGAGIEGERSGMWKHMARIIGEVLPRFVFVENSPMLVGRGLGTVLADFAEMGYDAEWGVVGAHHASAPHKRDRIWIVAESRSARTRRDYREARDAQRGASGKHVPALRQAHGADGSDRANAASPSADVADTAGSQDHAERGDCECGRHSMGRNQETAQQDHGAPDNDGSCGCCSNVANAMRERSEAGLPKPEQREERITEKPLNNGDRCGEVRHTPSEGLPDGIERPMGEPGAEPQPKRSDWWATEPDVGRVAHGVAARVDRLRCIGNGQVPAVVPIAHHNLSHRSLITRH